MWREKKHWLSLEKLIHIYLLSRMGFGPVLKVQAQSIFNTRKESEKHSTAQHARGHFITCSLMHKAPRLDLQKGLHSIYKAWFLSDYPYLTPVWRFLVQFNVNLNAKQTSEGYGLFSPPLQPHSTSFTPGSNWSQPDESTSSSLDLLVAQGLQRRKTIWPLPSISSLPLCRELHQPAAKCPTYLMSDSYLKPICTFFLKAKIYICM